MILGMSTATFTLVHVVISLVGIFAGLVVVFGMLGSKTLDGWTALFLATTVFDERDRFFLSVFDKILPSHIVGIIRWSCWRSQSSRSMPFTWRDPGAGSTW